MLEAGDSLHKPDLFGQVADWTGTGWFFAALGATLALIMLCTRVGPRYRGRAASIVSMAAAALSAAVTVAAMCWEIHLTGLYFRGSS
jgi:hypothetical protein